MKATTGLNVLGFYVDMHHDDIVPESLLKKKFFQEHCAVQTQKNMQIFLHRKVDLLAVCLSTYQ